MTRHAFLCSNLRSDMTFRCSSTRDLVGQKLKIVITHMGWPFYDHALYMLWAYENVYLDTATVNWMVGKELFNRMLREAVESVGSDRILFGSDQMVWPQMITPAIESIRSASFLSDQDKRNILGENARRLLKIAN